MNLDEDTISDVFSDKTLEEFLNCLSDVTDERNASYVKHPIQEILFIVFFAVLANADNWIEISRFANKKKKWLGRFLDLKNGLPSHDTIQRTLTLIRPDELHNIIASYFINVINEMDLLALQLSENDKELKEVLNEKEILSVDGKVSRGSSRKQTRNGKIAPLNTLSAYSSKYGMSLVQEYINEKTNEIPETPKLLKKLNISGLIVTWDALNTQKETVKVVIRGKGDYVAALKANQHNLYEDIKLYFDDTVENELRKDSTCYKKTTEKAHGNIETREYYITSDINWLLQKKEWSGLKTIAYEKKTIEKMNGDKTTESRYYICSLQEDVELFSYAARKHWQVENNLHWQLDFTFKEDANTTLEKRGLKALGVVKRNVLTLLQLVKDYYNISMSLLRFQISLDFENEVEELFKLVNVDMLKKAYESTIKEK